MVPDSIPDQSVATGHGSGDEGNSNSEQNIQNQGCDSARGQDKDHDCKKGRSKDCQVEDILSAHARTSALYCKPHTCNPCVISFTREKALLNHARTHHIDDNISILTNHKIDSNEYEITILANSNNKDETFTCYLCESIFDRFDFMKRHIRQHLQNEDGIIKEELYEVSHMCVHCGIFFKSKSELEIHSKQHLVSKNYPGKSRNFTCGKTFDSTNDLSKHESQMRFSLLSDNLCQLCGKQCEHFEALQNHLLIHCTDDNECTECNKTFGCRKSLKRHMMTHQRKKNVCDEYGDIVSDKQALNNHKANHHKENHKGQVDLTQSSTIVRVFPCTVCSQVFRSRSSQQIHTRRHTGERPYDCKYCNKAFADHGSLIKHQRIHTGEKPYVCPICTKAFNQRVLLRSHLKTHVFETKIRRGKNNYYKCSFCDYLFHSSIELHSHLVQHSDENTAKSRAVSVKSRKYQHRNNRVDCKDTWYLAQNITVVPDQSYSDSCESMLVEEQGVQSIMDNDDLPCNQISVTKPSESPVETFKIGNDNFVKNNHKSSKKLYKSEYHDSKTKSLLKMQTVELKNGECTETCSTVLSHSSISDLAAIDSPSREDSKENDNPVNPEDQKFSERMDLSDIKLELSEELTSEFDTHFNNFWNFEYNNEDQDQYYKHDEVMEAATDEVLTGSDILLNNDNIEEVGAYVELSAENTLPMNAKTISCDICDEIFEDCTEVMNHIRTMHFG